ncbi:hypothetical protein GIB67_038417 [Kingdonia uniflora]|uniref:Homeobox domain-containing protein n=1 Tax=Kingdonia uniflora TaxID=39325 RepID=A0A7J7NPE4_9MAGN|nr:hypothetical protein GIB67_038417 [Kingdonia uniflora]
MAKFGVAQEVMVGTKAKVAEMEAHVPDPNTPTVPSREVLCTLAEKFSASAERAGKTVVQPKQVWNWFQNRRYATKSKLVKSPGKLSVSSLPRDDSVPMRNAPHFVPGHVPVPVPVPAPPGRSQLENNIGQMEFEAKSARDGAWYDVATFVSQRGFVTGEPVILKAYPCPIYTFCLM